MKLNHLRAHLKSRYTGFLPAVFLCIGFVFHSQVRAEITHEIIDHPPRDFLDAYNNCLDTVRDLGYAEPEQLCVKGEGVVQAGWVWEQPESNEFYFHNFYYNRYYLLAGEPKVCPADSAGNPCSISSGVKFQTFSDFELDGPSAISFKRSYSTQGNFTNSLGIYWEHNFDYSLLLSSVYLPTPSEKLKSSLFDTPEEACQLGWQQNKQSWFKELLSGAESEFDGGLCAIKVGGKTVTALNILSDNPKSGVDFLSNKVVLKRPKGNQYVFNNNGGQWINPYNSKQKLSSVDGNWIFSAGNGNKEVYNGNGQLIEIQKRNGAIISLDYNLSSAEGGDDNSLSLDKVEDNYGNFISLTYSDGRVSKLSNPRGIVQYEYDAKGNLSKVIDEELNTTQYIYEKDLYPHHLTGIIDRKGIRYSTWDYDSEGRAILSEHAGGVEKVTFNHKIYKGTETTDATGATRQYSFEVIKGRTRVKSVSGDRCLVCGAGDMQSQSFNDLGERISKTDWNGVTTKYEYTNGFITKTIVAADTADEVVTTVVWDENIAQPTERVTDNRKETFTYDANGNVLTSTVTDLNTNESRTVSYVYNSSNRLVSINGPRTDIDDKTFIEYSAKGLVSKVTNALGHITSFTEYNSYGKPTKITHPNNLLEELSYSTLGRLLTRKLNGLTTSYEYDKEGLLTKITHPSGNYQNFEYDDARRLTAIVDAAGNRIEYMLDLVGNVTQTKFKDSNGVVTFTNSSEYDKVANLVKSISGENVESSFEYDAKGATTKATNGLLNTTEYTLDSMQRVSELLEPENTKTQYSYSKLGQILSVTDAENRQTTYEYNAFGDLTKLTSPDTGVQTFTYDSAGNLSTKTDARGIVTTFTYDALNRVTAQTYSNALENITYTYDETDNDNNGVGKLTSVTDSSGSTSYLYNALGQVTKETRTIDNAVYATEYHYDVYGRLSSITYPSGRILTYSFDSLDRVTGLSSLVGGTDKTLASNATYRPFGPMKGLTYGNNKVLTQSFDSDYRLTDKNVSGLLELNYTFDQTNNISSIVNLLEPSKNETFTYDKLSRLLTADGGFGDISYAYDKVGNRLSKTENSKPLSYDYNVSTHKLDSVSSSYIDDSQQAISLSPIGEWKFEETSGTTATDSSGNNYHGVIDSNVVIGQENTEIINSDYDYLFAFRTCSRVDLPSDQRFKMNKGSLSAWFKSENDTQWRVIIGRYNGTGISVYNNNLAVANNRAGTFDSGVNVNDGQWHHAVYTYENDVVDGSRLYLDGELILTTTNNEKSQVYPFVIGASVGCRNNFGGNIDNVAIYEDILSASDVEKLYQNGKGKVVNEVTSFNYDAAGNTLIKGDLTFSYNHQGRMATASKAGMNADYLYNFKGERSSKLVNGAKTHFIYNLQGQLIAEADGNGVIKQEYIYFNGQRLASVNNGTLYYVHTSHLDTPLALTDEAGTVQWQAHYTPFGKVIVDVDNVTQAARFPGQYLDEETGLYYNYFRDYDPEIGRYIQSDPIGLNGGINTYGYVSQNPLKYTDFYGLSQNDTCVEVAHSFLGLVDVYVCVPAPPPAVPDIDPNQQMAGRQDTPNTIPHHREREILNMPPGGSGCDNLNRAIKDLDKTIKWRRGDLNPNDGDVFRSHKKYIQKLEKKRSQLKREANDKGCKEDCD